MSMIYTTANSRTWSSWSLWSHTPRTLCMWFQQKIQACSDQEQEMLQKQCIVWRGERVREREITIQRDRFLPQLKTGVNNLLYRRMDTRSQRRPCTHCTPMRKQKKTLQGIEVGNHVFFKCSNLWCFSSGPKHSNCIYQVTLSHLSIRHRAAKEKNKLYDWIANRNTDKKP